MWLFSGWRLRKRCALFVCFVVLVVVFFISKIHHIFIIATYVYFSMFLFMKILWITLCCYFFLSFSSNKGCITDSLCARGKLDICYRSGYECDINCCSSDLCNVWSDVGSDVEGWKNCFETGMVQGNVSSFQVSRVALVYSKWTKKFFFWTSFWVFTFRVFLNKMKLRKCPNSSSMFYCKLLCTDFFFCRLFIISCFKQKQLWKYIRAPARMNHGQI